ncbi:MAG TPA: TIGR00725 family protein [Planctomycetota bacterium]|nr:TIGR00725 family protein [Planctomycetota bacterium]
MPMRIVAVIGAGIAGAPLRRQAEEVGRRLAHAGVVVLTGGRGGVMEAASRGAKKAGGLVVALVPEGRANPYVDIVIPTHMGDARNVLIANTAGAFVAIGGAYGTLSEIAFALKRRKRVVGLGSWRIPGMISAKTPAEAVRKALTG